ncbi:MAG: YdcF family protein [Thiohalocapsa sp. PB-PSB1]|nr:MAG: YdcF family protein [Thiohalocapsa sp. PB-PSB1]HCS89264.1 YdcF family protein [Chromatiaceae bacterium]
MLTSKILTQLALPLGSGGLLIIIGVLALLFRHRLAGTGLAMTGLLWIWLCAIPAFSNWLCGSLEQQYPSLPLASVPEAAAAVVLGGGLRGAQSPHLFPDLNNAADRVWHAARVFHAGKTPLVVLSGGGFAWRPAHDSEAAAMLAFLLDLGVPREHVVLETRSRTTRENALETRRKLEPLGIQHILLITSALHMRRARATFAAVGFDVIPVASDHEVAFGKAKTLLDYLPNAESLERSSRAVKEYLGFWVYWTRGWTIAP